MLYCTIPYHTILHSITLEGMVLACFAILNHEDQPWPWTPESKPLDAQTPNTLPARRTGSLIQSTEQQHCSIDACKESSSFFRRLCSSVSSTKRKELGSFGCPAEIFLSDLGAQEESKEAQRSRTERDCWNWDTLALALGTTRQRPRGSARPAVLMLFSHAAFARPGCHRTRGLWTKGLKESPGAWPYFEVTLCYGPQTQPV